jgi:hypothetical protein
MNQILFGSISLTASLLCLLAAAPVSIAQTGGNHDRDEHVKQLYELGFLHAFTENTGESIQEIISNLTEEQEDDFFDTVVINAFDRKLMESVIKASLRRSYREAEATEAISHLSRPEFSVLMKQLYDSDTDLDDPEQREAFEDFINELEFTASAYENRIDLLGEILRASQKTRLTVQTLEDFLSIIIFTINQTSPEDERLTDRQVNDLVISLRNNFRQFFDNLLLYIALYTTLTIDEEVLQQHADFLKSVSGRWFIRTYNNAVLNSFGEISEKTASNLAEWALSRSAENQRSETEDFPGSN